MKADAHQQERVSKGVAAEARSLIQKLRLLLAIFVLIYSLFFPLPIHLILTAA